MKASAKAYAIQGLIKYHGLRNKKQRIPYHDSISVCTKALPTVTTVECDTRRGKDTVRIDGKVPSAREFSRVTTVLNRIRQLSSKRATRFRVESRNPEVDGKGLGFSASGFAALGLAASTAIGLSIDTRGLSQVVRLGAGSASRSLVGGFSIWYANKGGSSYAEQLSSAESVGMRTVIVPIHSDVKTDKAHEESMRSPFYGERLRLVPRKLAAMRRAIRLRDVNYIGRLAEEDTLSLHAVTMTGPMGMVLFNPLSIQVMEEVRRLRAEDDVAAWFSLDTGPSVFINTSKDASSRVLTSIRRIAESAFVSDPGGPAHLLNQHLF